MSVVLIIPTRVVELTICVCTRSHNGLSIKMDANIPPRGEPNSMERNIKTPMIYSPVKAYMIMMFLVLSVNHNIESV